MFQCGEPVAGNQPMTYYEVKKGRDPLHTTTILNGDRTILTNEISLRYTFDDTWVPLDQPKEIEISVEQTLAVKDFGEAMEGQEAQEAQEGQEEMKEDLYQEIKGGAY